MLATNMSDATSSEEKLRWAFKMYDQDSSGLDGFLMNSYATDFHLGTIDLTEMVEIVGNLYEMEGVAKVYQMTMYHSHVGIPYFTEKHL